MAIFIREKHILTTIASLSDVMRNASKYGSRYSGHSSILEHQKG
jgi:hypothetical protein